MLTHIFCCCCFYYRPRCPVISYGKKNWRDASVNSRHVSCYVTTYTANVFPSPDMCTCSISPESKTTFSQHEPLWIRWLFFFLKLWPFFEAIRQNVHKKQGQLMNNLPTTTSSGHLQELGCVRQACVVRCYNRTVPNANLQYSTYDILKIILLSASWNRL